MSDLIKTFRLEELQEIIAPYELIDVLNSLVFNMYLTTYSINYDNGTVELQIPANMQIKEILDELSQPPIKNGKKEIH